MYITIEDKNVTFNFDDHSESYHLSDSTLPLIETIIRYLAHENDDYVTHKAMKQSITRAINSVDYSEQIRSIEERLANLESILE